MDSTEKQEHARRIVAEYLDDNLEFSYVYEDEDLEDHEDAWRDIHNLCGEIIKDLRAVVKTGNLFYETVWTDDGDSRARENLADMGLDDDHRLCLPGSSIPATDEELRAAGLVKQSRFTTLWRVEKS